jgi:hypothetical protein
MFQSSLMSWSSHCIETETVDSSQRISGSLQDSSYSHEYSSKSVTSSPGGVEVPRRWRIFSRVRGEPSST